MSYYKGFNKIIIKVLIISGFISLCFIRCEKNDFLKKPSVKTMKVEGTTASTALAYGEFININDYDVTEFGFCWSENPTSTKEDNFILIDQDVSNNLFNSQITGLDASKKYYLRAFAVNSVGIGYGDEIDFTTMDGDIKLTTKEVSNITAKTAMVGGNITDNGGGEITDRGVCYDLKTSPSISDYFVKDDSVGTGEFSCFLNNLLPDTVYYLKSYAINDAGTCYGNEVSFRTEDGLPILTTIEVSNIGTSTAVASSSISDNGGFAVTAKGVCYDTESLPIISNGHTTDGTGLGSFQSNIEGLVIGTKYYLRAYASNEIGTSYGEELVFFTDVLDYDNNEYDVVIIGNQAWMAENLKAIHYASGDEMVDGKEADQIWGDSTTRYYFSYDNDDSYVEKYGRLYNWAAAMNSPIKSVPYSFKIQGACPDEWRMPCDEDWKELESTLGMSEGDMNNYGMRGVDEGSKLKSTTDWASNGNGTDELGFSVYPAGRRDGAGFMEMSYYSIFWAGIEINNHEGLNRWLVYDEGGIGADGTSVDGGHSVRCIYGKACPTVFTLDVYDITYSTAKVEYYVSSDGGEYVEESGIYYSTSPNAELTGTKVQISEGIGNYTVTLTNLTPDTTYYIKAYAKNNTGTSYGFELNFETFYGSVTDYDGNIYHSIKIGNQEWMAENLKTTHYADGTEITLVEDSATWANGTNAKAYCYYENSIENTSIYGLLYTWIAAMNQASASNLNPSGVQGACPDGWHLPSDDEWVELIDYLGGISIADEKLKTTSGWTGGNGTDDYGFSALPAGLREENANFGYLGYATAYWTASDQVSYFFWGPDLMRLDDYWQWGYSVRCVKNE